MGTSLAASGGGLRFQVVIGLFELGQFVVDGVVGLSGRLELAIIDGGDDAVDLGVQGGELPVQVG